MLKVAIIGCGKIADSHALALQRLGDNELVAVCDREELMARQLADRFSVRHYFGDVAALLRDSKPDLVHITTPPQGHYEIAKQCLEAGCHVYIEKPFTLYTWEAEELVMLAKQKQLQMTAGHDEQYSHAMQRLRRAVQSGYLGGAPVHMESTWCYEIGEESYAGALLGDKRHWVRKLPGRLLHNLISHGIAKIAEYLPGENAEVVVVGFTSRIFKNFNEMDIIDELRVTMTAEDNTTASFLFSTQMRPGIHQFRIFGPQNGLVLDEDQQTMIKLRGKRYKSYAEKFVPPVMFAGQYLQNLAANFRLFLGNDFHMDSSKKHLIGSFYRSITNNTPPPISYREILLTSRIMDSIFRQLASRSPVANKKAPLESALV